MKKPLHSVFILLCCDVILGVVGQFQLIIEANNITYPIDKEGFNHVEDIVNIKIKGLRKDLSTFEYNHGHNDNDQNVRINIGHILSGQKADYCVYMKNKKMPICGFIAISPEKIRLSLS